MKDLFSDEDMVAMTGLHWQLIELCRGSGLNMGHATIACLLTATALNRSSGRVSHEALTRILASMETIPDTEMTECRDLGAN